MKKSDYNVKISEIKSKIPNFSRLATSSTLTVVKNKICDVSNLVKNTIIMQKLLKLKTKKVTDHDHYKYITTPKFNVLTAKSFAARLAQSNLVTKTDIDPELISLNKKIDSSKGKYLLVENELKKLQTFDSSCFGGKNYFEDDGTQNYLVFQPMYKYFKKTGNTDHISGWKSKRLSDKIIKPPSTTNNSLAPALSYFGTKTRLKFNGSCLKQDKIT